MRLPNRGETFEQRYELLEVLGQGGFAIVYRAMDVSVSREVALKVLLPDSGAYGGTVKKRFVREAEVFASLEDPHTITMYDFGESQDGLLYMVFEYVRGEDLATLLKRRELLEPAVVAHILIQLLAALREAHERGIFHRDIKPANVLVYEYFGDAFRVKLLDFGIAKDMNAVASITRTGKIVGTPRYMAPEALFGEPFGADSDLYGLGLLAFELLTGRRAIEGTTNEQILKQVVSSSPIVLPAGSAPRALRQIVEKLAAKERAYRYQSAADVLADLRAASREIAARTSTSDSSIQPDVQAPPLRPEPHQQASSPEHVPGRRTMWMFGAASLAVTVVVIIATWAAQPEPALPPRTSSANVSGLIASAPVDAGRLDGVEQPIADADSPDLTPGDGCGRAVERTGLLTMREPLSGRRWYAYVPPNYDPRKQHPVVLLFHRMWIGGAEMVEETEVSRAAEAHGFIVFSFDSDRQPPWQASDDIDYVIAAMGQGFAELCADRSRVFGIGDGAGGGFVKTLACARPLSGIVATASGENFTTEVCMPRTPTPRMRIYGALDRHIPPEGGAGCVLFMNDFRSASEIDDRWRGAYECSGKAKPWAQVPGGRCRTWTCDVAPLVTCQTDGGHYWPKAEAVSFELAGCKTEPPEVAFDYLGAIWRFFEREGRTLPESDQLRVP